MIPSTTSKWPWPDFGASNMDDASPSDPNRHTESGGAFQACDPLGPAGQIPRCVPFLEPEEPGIRTNDLANTSSETQNKRTPGEGPVELFVKKSTIATCDKTSTWGKFLPRWVKYESIWIAPCQDFD